MQSISTKSLLTKYCNDHTVFQKCRAKAGLSKTAKTSLQPEWLFHSVHSSDFD
jgi:hypothetical protein